MPPTRSKYASVLRAKSSPATRKISLKIGLLFTSLLTALTLVEIGLRLLNPGLASPALDERSLTYQYDPDLGWFPIPNSKKTFTASRTITTAHNSKGFRGPERDAGARPNILFLGDSLVWGFDVEEPERFTEQLQAKHPEWTVHNLGVSGYGTDQEYLLLQKHFDEYHPRVVFLVVCGDNDNEDNSWNFRGGYYKPFYTLEGGRLKVNGVPVPKSAKVLFAEHRILSSPCVMKVIMGAYCRLSQPRPSKNPEPPTGALLLDMRSYVTNRGAIFAVGLQQSNSDLEKFLEDFNIPHTDLTATNTGDRYPEYGKHWTPQGHAAVTEKINRLLEKL